MAARNDSRKFFYCLVISLVLLVSAGCVGIQSFPHTARAGETITLAIGSGVDVNRGNTTISYTPDDPTMPVVDLTPHIVGLFKLYPDKSSYAWLDSQYTAVVPLRARHEPWQNSVAINLPVTLPDSSPFPVGPGRIQVTTTADYDLGTSGSTSPNDVTVALEVLPGTGEPFPGQYDKNGVFTGDYADLEPQPQVVIRAEESVVTCGAVELILDIPMRQGDGVTLVHENAIEVFREHINYGAITVPPFKSSQAQVNWRRTGDDLALYFTSPIGMPSFEIASSVVLRNSRLGNHFVSAPGPSVKSITYYDLDGNVIAGPMPTVTLRQ